MLNKHHLGVSAHTHTHTHTQSTTEDLMRFVKELRRANSALVDAFEKSKKRQQAEKKRMKQELVSYMNRVQSSYSLYLRTWGATISNGE